VSRERVVLTKEELRQLIRETVSETFLALGVDIKEPIEVQADFLFIHTCRKNLETIKNHAFYALVFILLSSMLGAVWYGVRHFVQ